MDLHLLPIHRRDGEDLPDLPGLFIADAGIARRTARSRKGDLLVLHLVIEGTATLTPEGQAQILETLALDYFGSSGSVTNALQSMVRQLNDFLLERNRENTDRSLQATGRFTALVVHSGQVYTVQSGDNHIFTVHAIASQRFHEPLLSGKGLGLARSAAAHLNHAPLDEGDLIIITPEPPPAWKSDSLQKAYGRPFKTIHRVLLDAAGPDLRAVLIQAHPGKGRFKLLKPEQLHTVPAPVNTPPPARAPESAVEAAEREAPIKAAQSGGGAPPELPDAADSEPAPASSISPVVSANHASTEPTRITREKTSIWQTIGRGALAVLRAFVSALKAVGYSIRSLISRVLPGTELFTIPASTMAFVAIAIPVLVVTVAGVVYFRRGQTSQFNNYLAKAQEVAAFAQTRTDPGEVRISWTAVIDYVDLAESYQVTEETQALRAQAYAALDPLDGIERLDFQPALLSPLGESVNIVRMVATRDEIFMLDATSGSVIRAWLSGRGFEIDTEFRCGSFGNATYSIGKLIDLAPLPQNNLLEADVFAMDADGNALYCKDDGSPPVAQPVAPPTSNWGDPQAFVLDSGALYVLDPQTNAVWIYGGTDYSFVNPPRLFFDEDVPQIEGVIDFAVDLDDLYMLYSDGRITTCTFGFAGQPTRCEGPAIFTDTRTDRESGPVIEGTAFSQIRFSPPPDPSIYLLDRENGAVYHFSLRLTFQRQFRPLEVIEGEATAFAVSPGRMMFLAYGNEVFWALIP